jgi:hypothetical protein
MIEFQEFRKIARLSREIVVTEKIDGTNGVIWVSDDVVNPTMLVGSRSRWITPEDDNFGFAKWARQHEAALIKGLGPGFHYGEWWGQGIQRKYGQERKHFSLFNTSRWKTCCSDAPDLTPLPALYEINVVPVLYRGPFHTNAIDDCLTRLRMTGSIAAPGFKDPEGIVIYHTHGNVYFKKTIKNDEQPKSQVKA